MNSKSLRKRVKSFSINISRKRFIIVKLNSILVMSHVFTKFHGELFSSIFFVRLAHKKEHKNHSFLTSKIYWRFHVFEPLLPFWVLFTFAVCVGSYGKSISGSVKKGRSRELHATAVKHLVPINVPVNYRNKTSTRKMWERSDNLQGYIN